MKEDVAGLLATYDRWLALLDGVRFTTDEGRAGRVKREVLLRLIMAGVAVEAGAIDGSCLQVSMASDAQAGTRLDRIASFIDRLDVAMERLHPSASLFPLTRSSGIKSWLDPGGSDVAAFNEWITNVAGSVVETIGKAPLADAAGLFYERHVATGKNKRGIVYTPAQVCQLVADRAVGSQVAELVREVREGTAAGDGTAVAAAVTRLSGFAVLDPACGTGPFLVASLRLLGAARIEAERVTGTRVPGSLAGQVRGIDEDPSAVGIARFNMYIAAGIAAGKEGSGGSDGPAIDVPPIITVSDIITDVGLQGAGVRFDAVIGNPPYVNYKKYLDRIDRGFLEVNYLVFDGQADLSYYFFEIHARLLKDGGISGQVSSRYFMQASHARRLREFLARHEILEVVDMNACGVFPGIGIHPLLFFFKKVPPREGHLFAYREVPAQKSMHSLTGDAIDALPAKNVRQSTLRQDGWCLLSDDELRIQSKFDEHPRLGDLGDVLGGAETGHDGAFAGSIEVVDGEPVGFHLGKAYPLEREIVHPWLKNGDIREYHHAPGRWCIYIPPDIDDDAFRARYPGAFAYLSCFKAELEARDNGKIQVPWYAWRRPRNVRNLDAGEKVVMPYKASKPRAAIDAGRSYCSYDVTVFLPRPGAPSLGYIAGVLNSLPTAWYFSTRGKRMGAIYEFYSGPVSKLRVPIPDAVTERRVSKLVEEATAIARQLHGSATSSEDGASLRRELASVQARIDEAIFRTLGASQEDVRAITRTTRPGK